MIVYDLEQNLFEQQFDFEVFRTDCCELQPFDKCGVAADY